MLNIEHFEGKDIIMESAEMLRKIDELGRVILPAEIRKRLDVKENDSVDFSWDGHQVILKKHGPICSFCGSTDNLLLFAGKYICKACLDKLSQLK